MNSALRSCAIAIPLLVALVLAPSQNASATVYRGFPHLHLTTAIVTAGGGAARFDAYRLVSTLAGSQSRDENAKLLRQYGASRVDSFYTVFTFAVHDAVKRAHAMLIPFPKNGRPDPADGRALSEALYQAGMTPAGKYDVGYMLEELISHQIHHNIMGDMDRKFTAPENANFHLILTAVMNDLKREYSLT